MRCPKSRATDARAPWCRVTFAVAGKISRHARIGNLGFEAREHVSILRTIDTGRALPALDLKHALFSPGDLTTTPPCPRPPPPPQGSDGGRECQATQRGARPYLPAIAPGVA